MSSPRAQQKRLVLGAWLAALSILANAALHSTWAQEPASAPAGLGGGFSICLAHGGPAGPEPMGNSVPADATIDYCALCVLPTSITIPAIENLPDAVVFDDTGAVMFAYAEPMLVTQFAGIKFDARGPPA